MTDETYSQRLAQRLRQENLDFERDRIARAQAQLDFYWQQKLDAEASLDDGFDYSTGFKEPRYRTSCHRGRGDPDYGL